MKQTVAVKLLNEWCAIVGGKNPRMNLAVGTGLSLSLINQMFCGKAPGEISQIKISNFTEIKRNELFPVCEAAKKSA